MEMKTIVEGVKGHVLTPAAKGAVQAILEQFTAPKRGGGSIVSSLALLGIGMAIGAGVALMLAPATGKEVRARLMGLVSKLETKDEVAAPDGEEVEPDKGAKPDGAGGGNSYSRRQRAPIAPPTS